MITLIKSDQFYKGKIETERIQHLYSLYKKYCKTYYTDLNEDGYPTHKDPSKETIIWSKIRTEEEF